MDNNTVHRPQSPTLSQPANESSKHHTRITSNNFKLVFPFNFPLTLEAAASRINTNLGYYKIHYTLFVWSILFIALLPQRKLSLILLVGMTNITCLYLLILRSFPNSAILHQIADKRLVLFLLAIITMVEMILTRSAVHFFVTLVGATPVILLHALLRVRYCLFMTEASCVREGLDPVIYFVPRSHEKNEEYEPLRLV